MLSDGALLERCRVRGGGIAPQRFDDAEPEHERRPNEQDVILSSQLGGFWSGRVGVSMLSARQCSGTNDGCAPEL